MKYTSTDSQIAAKRCNEIYRRDGLRAYNDAKEEFEFDVKSNREMTDKEKEDVIYWFNRYL